MTLKKKHDIKKITDKKHDYRSKCDNTPQEIKEALNVLLNLRVNIYQRIYHLTRSPSETWKQFDFLSSKSKISAFIERLKKEVQIIRSKDFNYEKYKEAIVCILGKDVEKFTDTMIKNMYIAKLQNIIFLLAETNDNEGIKEVKNTNKSAQR